LLSISGHFFLQHVRSRPHLRLGEYFSHPATNSGDLGSCAPFHPKDDLPSTVILEHNPG
jgi:hypothetical protein